MASTKDKAIGKIKEVVAEIIGEGELAEEGKRQKHEERPAPKQPPGPFESLRKLT
jgi:hypothetical protein